ncbi:hypothetical protein HD806DRAFT_493110 [Xylariaceae sp. AK1471]|nr:hypothetical protein HD806DRAFT_493110 [Xylariaceae sp. AK1471]
MAPPSKKRRPHHKSRKGCQQCKQRHIKCDERQPHCLQCTMTGRSCSNVHLARSSNIAQVSDSTSPLTPIAIVNSSSSKSDSVAKSDICYTASANASPLDPVMREMPQHVYDLNHLALLHHIENDMMKPPNTPFVANEEDAQKLLEMVITSALSTPYLMDQVLALAALHLSVLTSDATKQRQYRHQAVHLQSRALALYNAANPEVTDQNCTALLLFTSFVGMHMLFDTVSAQTDLLELLDKFIQFAGLHRGVGVVSKLRWHIIRKSELRSIVSVIEAAEDKLVDQQPSGSICDKLLNLLDTAKYRLGPSSLQACHDAVQSLQWTFNQYSALQAPINRHIVFAWPVRISIEYLEMLRSRQPEALVIMAHWALLLHRERDFWVFGQGGQFLIEAISSYLGAYWDSWMMPLREIMTADSIPKT